MEEGHEVTEISTLSTTLDVHAMRSSIRSITSCTLKKGAPNLFLLFFFFTFTRKMSFKSIQNYCFMQSTLIDAVKIRAPSSGTLSLSTEQNKTCYDFSLHNLHAVSDKKYLGHFHPTLFFHFWPLSLSSQCWLSRLTRQILRTNIGRARRQQSVPTILTESVVGNWNKL